MDIRDNLYELIDKFLLGEIKGEELLEFESEISKNPELANDIKEQKEIVDLINIYNKDKQLKSKLNIIHNELNLRPIKIKKDKRLLYVFSNIAIAASIALIATFSFLYFSGWFDYGKHVNTYTELSNKLNDLSTTQKSIWEALVSSEEEVEEVKPALPNGTSFMISSNGFLITNYHVVRNVDSILVVNKQDSLIKYKAGIIYSDKNLDLAILQINDKSFGSSGKIPYVFNENTASLGEYVYTLGYSKEDIVFGEGSVSSLTGFDEDTIAYEISIPVNPGNSGGPLIDSNGNVIGMISGKHSEKSGATFAIKSDFLLSIIDSVNFSNSEIKIELPSKNKIKWLKRKDQIKNLKPFIYKVEVYR